MKSDSLSHRRVWIPLSLAALLATGSLALAQTSPTPGPTNPNPAPPAKSPTIVINPTEDQCRQGWNATQPWTRQEFENFCRTLRTAK